jgi:hypothetical protein
MGLRLGRIWCWIWSWLFLRLSRILVAEWLSFGGISVRLGRRVLLDSFAGRSFQMSS